MSTTDPEFYSYLVANLPPEFSTRLDAVFTYADQRKAARGECVGAMRGMSLLGRSSGYQYPKSVLLPSIIMKVLYRGGGGGGGGGGVWGWDKS